MNYHKPQKGDDYRTPDSARPMQRKHDDFVNEHAERLGVEPSAVLQSVRDFGFTADDIAAAEDASALTRFPKGNGPAISFKVIETRPVSHPRRHEQEHDTDKECREYKRFQDGYREPFENFHRSTLHQFTRRQMMVRPGNQTS